MEGNERAVSRAELVLLSTAYVCISMGENRKFVLK